MTDFVDTLKQIPGFVCFSKVSKDEIETAERILGVRFSEEYRKYIEDCGAASFKGHELTGVCKVKYLNVVDATMEARKLNPTVPEKYYVIEDANVDGILIWQEAKGEVFESTPWGSWKMVAHSLSQYLKL